MSTALTKAEIKVNVRYLIRRDIPEVIAIERARELAPWTEEGLLAHLRHRNKIGIVAEHEGRVVGYMVYELRRNSIALLNLAVMPVMRRCGMGSQLVAKLAGKLNPERRTKIEAVVRETDLGTQLFLRGCGFRAVGVSREHFADTGEDGYGFRHKISVRGEGE